MRPTLTLSRRTALAGLGATAIAATLAACGTTGTQDSGSQSGAPAGEGDASKVDVVTWWSAGSEKLGLDALVAVFEEQFPDTAFENKAVSGGAGSQAKQKLAADLAASNPPDTYQAHAGAELKDDIEAGYLTDVSSLYEEFGLKDAFPATLMDRLTDAEGAIYSVPSNIHRANVVWASVSALKAAGLDPAKPAADIEAWIADMEKVKEAGLTPITMGMAWTQLQLLETVLIADLGHKAYSGLFDGSTDWAGPEVAKALEHYRRIVALTDTSLYTEDWEPAMKPIMDGKAAFNVMGDWAVAAFDAAGLKAGTDYVHFPVPGTDGVFDFLADSFTLPDGAAHPGGAKNWLNCISSKEGQIAFNTVKGSIPARTDLSDEDRAAFSDYQRSAMDSFASDTIVSSIAHGAALPAKASNAMNDALTKFAQGASDIATLQADLKAAYDAVAS
ncbi:ABC transporter substrate-binding protein [Actinomyces capricornis]|uniref:Probable sugar-binding periplasmic protein n=1 Tax=Actinomyces capricornis TaxID=2755559 RepID=A0ABN6K1M8_9ACTO|nr:ABC transporter substrate-binding protein [Actinomyces capricornis]BDA63509.1 sugar ABC transporter substrate-binding protein [Actinomyces capricornis]